MRNFIITLWVVSTGLAICPRAYSESTNLPITFYIVRDQKFEGGRFFDSFPFPKLGYISSKPDLTVTHLKALSLEETRDQPAHFADRNGKTRKGKVIYPGRLFFTLMDQDFQRLRVLAKKPAGHRLLVMHGERPLTLTSIADAAETPVFWTSLNTANRAELEIMEDELKKLLPSGAH